jgi:uncharacterized coiled-coil protein SlyX
VSHNTYTGLESLNNDELISRAYSGDDRLAIALAQGLEALINDDEGLIAVLEKKVEALEEEVGEKESEIDELEDKLFEALERIKEMENANVT